MSEQNMVSLAGRVADLIIESKREVLTWEEYQLL